MPIFMEMNMKNIDKEISWWINIFAIMAGWVILALDAWTIIDINLTEALVVIIFIILASDRYRK